jgi:hypothetical protein
VIAERARCRKSGSVDEPPVVASARFQSGSTAEVP